MQCHKQWTHTDRPDGLQPVKGWSAAPSSAHIRLIVCLFKIIIFSAEKTNIFTKVIKYKNRKMLVLAKLCR